MAENCPNLVKDKFTDSGSSENPWLDKLRENHAEMYLNQATEEKYFF